MEKTKKPFYKKWWFWVLVFLFLLMMGNMNTGKKSEPEETAPEEVVEHSTEDKLTDIFNNLKIKNSDYKIVQGTPDTDRYAITFHYDDESWDETWFVTDMFTEYVNLCREGYELDGVNKIQFYVFVDLKDSKGNIKSEKGMAICMPKDKFETYNWDNMKYEKQYETYNADCDLWDIHPGIRSKVDFAEVMYKGK